MQFCVLGTKAGGAPLVHKHASATALLIGGSEVLLFDCAEDTQTQLLRAGISRAHINHIFLSHLHGDHILGLLPLLTTMSGEKRTAPLHIYTPPGLKEFVEVGMKVMDVIPSFPLIFHTLESPERTEIAVIQQYRIFAQLLEHRIPSFGFRVDEPPHRNVDIQKARALGIEEGAVIGRIKREGYAILPDNRIIQFDDIAVTPQRPQHSFVYCGDTRKCRATIELAYRATVLLHEATFCSDASDKAYERFHCTSIDAAEVARDAEVQRLYLTHISVRYPSGTPLLHEACSVFPATSLAQELEIVTI
ncbi:MAG: ribonuclease Z [Bacteroidota bacterium]|nr:ribonuclease Z [Candidatus Kapabacteria bacterium]MDW8219404.1 ribonuclease Z [Bacteroidota bacterium]